MKKREAEQNMKTPAEKRPSMKNNKLITEQVNAINLTNNPILKKKYKTLEKISDIKKGNPNQCYISFIQLYWFYKNFNHKMNSTEFWK